MENKFQVGNVVNLFLPNRTPTISLIESVEMIIRLSNRAKGYIVFDLRTQEYRYFEDENLQGDSTMGFKIVVSEPELLNPNNSNEILRSEGKITKLEPSEKKGNYSPDVVNQLNQNQYINNSLYKMLRNLRKDVKGKDWISEIKNFIIQNNLISVSTLNIIDDPYYKIYKGKNELIRWIVELGVIPSQTTIDRVFSLQDLSSGGFETFKFLYEKGFSPSQEAINNFFLSYEYMKSIKSMQEKWLMPLMLLLKNGMKPDQETFEKIIDPKNNFSDEFICLIEQY